MITGLRISAIMMVCIGLYMLSVLISDYADGYNTLAGILAVTSLLPMAIGLTVALFKMEK